MPTDRARRGAAVEAAAERLLCAAGLQVLDRNVNFRGGELDRVMNDDGTVVFVEVRYRARTDFGGAAASVDSRKQQRLVLAAQLYLQAHPELCERPCRFDVVQASGDPPRLQWLRDAFRLDS